MKAGSRSDSGSGSRSGSPVTFEPTKCYCIEKCVQLSYQAAAVNRSKIIQILRFINLDFVLFSKTSPPQCAKYLVEIGFSLFIELFYVG